MFLTPFTTPRYSSGSAIRLATKIGVISELNHISERSRTPIVGTARMAVSKGLSAASIRADTPAAIPSKKAITVSIAIVAAMRKSVAATVKKKSSLVRISAVAAAMASSLGTMSGCAISMAVNCHSPSPAARPQSRYTARVRFLPLPRPVSLFCCGVVEIILRHSSADKFRISLI